MLKMFKVIFIVWAITISAMANLEVVIDASQTVDEGVTIPGLPRMTFETHEDNQTFWDFFESLDGYGEF